PVAPVVPPLTTGFAPRRAGLKDNEPQVRSAEAAILAAAAATGAEVGRLGPASGDDSPYKRPRGKAPGTANPFAGLRQYVGLAVAGTLLLAAGFGLYWVLGMGRGTTEAPVLTADATPAKQPPAPADAATEEAPRSVVFDEINGVAAADDAETLVSRDETAGADVAEVARVVAEPPAATESGLANRKVRTVTVRPDGTIVSGDEAIAGSEALPVDRPNVPVVPGASVEPSDLLTAAVGEAEPLAATPEPDPIAAVITDGQAPAAGAPPVEMAALAPAGTTPPVFDASLVAPVPMPRPVDRNALRSAAPAPAGTLAELPLVGLDAPAAAPATAAAAYVQISSQPTEADAQAAVRSAQARWGSLFNGNQLIVQRADLGAKGVKYRVRLPAASLQEATQICASIKADGGDCFATNG
ncbi:SPOR domain-containing protein, partial [Devosia sp.]|uniref:SPOR domain-containing protein n=1 Tax=Devosia sp. TaxID=1871048 RepID=UPI002F0C8AED